MSTTLPEVTHEDIPNFWHGDTSEFTTDYLDGKLGEVVDKIASRWGALVARRLAEGKLTDRLYRGTVVRIASRVFGNPEGFKSEAEGGYNYELNAAVASGTIWFTDDDITDLTGENPKDKGNRMGTITVSRHRPRGNW